MTLQVYLLCSTQVEWYLHLTMIDTSSFLIDVAMQDLTCWITIESTFPVNQANILDKKGGYKPPFQNLWEITATSLQKLTPDVIGYTAIYIILHETHR